MKVCIRTHDVVAFGTIPKGSLWADDSPYLVEVDAFADLDPEPEPDPPKPAPVRKSNLTKKKAGGS